MSRKKHKQRKERERRERVRQEGIARRESARRTGAARSPGRRGPPLPVRPGRGAGQAGPRGPSPFLGERAQRWVLWARGTRGLPSAEEVQQLVASGELSAYKDDPREAAQELAFQALEAGGEPQRAEFLALQALHFDPRCTDARRVLADLQATSAIDRVGRLKKTLLEAAEALGDLAETFQGRLSDAVEARPYLRARLDLACSLWAAERAGRGREHLETLHGEDAPDLLGVRYLLLMARLHEGDAEGAGELLEDGEVASAELIVRWARVLQKLLAGDGEAAEGLYEALRTEHAAEALSLSSPPPVHFAYPGYYRDDVMVYAGLCLRMLHAAWHVHPAAARWLEEHAARERSGAADSTVSGA